MWICESCRLKNFVLYKINLIFLFINFEKSSSGLIDETRQETEEIISPEEIKKDSCYIYWRHKDMTYNTILVTVIFQI